MKKGLMQVFVANLIYLGITFFTNFILPKFISVDSYAVIKTYSLYLFYIGFFHLGYNDGMYLEYGGKDIRSIFSNELGTNFYSILFVQLVFTVMAIIPAIFAHSPLLIMLAFAITLTNTVSYMKTLFQAVGEFKLYGRALNYERFLMLLGYVLLIFIAKSDNPYLYILVALFASGITLLILFWMTNKLNSFGKYVAFSKVEIKKNIRTGFPLLMGGLSSNIFTGIDRWFVKILMDSFEFAMYSFAVSMENMINVFLTPITVSMYNYFCKENKQEKVLRIKNAVLIWGFIIIVAAFPAKWILENYLTAYVSSSSIVFILFATQVFYVIIKGIYVNIYKAEQKQNKYMKQTFTMTLVAFGFNVLFYFINHSMLAIALGTLATSIVWLIVCELDRPDLKFSMKQIIYIVVLLLVYLYCGYKLNSIMGLLIYLSMVIVFSLIFMRDSFLYLIGSGIHMIKSKICGRLYR